MTFVFRSEGAGASEQYLEDVIYSAWPDHLDPSLEEGVHKMVGTDGTAGYVSVAVATADREPVWRTDVIRTYNLLRGYVIDHRVGPTAYRLATPRVWLTEVHKTLKREQ